jgi:hypothetical protein
VHSVFFGVKATASTVLKPASASFLVSDAEIPASYMVKGDVHEGPRPRNAQIDRRSTRSWPENTHLQLCHQHRRVQAFLVLSFIADREHLVLGHDELFRKVADVRRLRM